MTADIPKRDTPEYCWWLAGAKAEARAIREEMEPGRATEVYDFVLSMAQSRYDADEMTDMVATVYTCERPLRRRLVLAWDIVWGPYAMKIRSAWRRWKTKEK